MICHFRKLADTEWIDGRGLRHTLAEEVDAQGRQILIDYDSEAVYQVRSIDGDDYTCWKASEK
jgi:hypothetical protein